MIRVLQLGMTDNLGGIETYLMNYYRNIDKSEIQFDFGNIYSNKLCYQDEIEHLGGKVYKLCNYYHKPFQYVKELKNIIKNNKYQIVHCNMNSAVMLWPLIGAKLGGAKVIIAHAHNSSSDKGFLKTLLHHLNRHLIPIFANTYFACSNKAGKWFFSNAIINSSNYHTIYNAIDVNCFLFNEKIRKQKREELGIGDKTIVIGHVGRFCKQKNHHFLIDVFNEYQKKNSNSILVLIGQGPLLGKIKNKVIQLGLTDKVKFLGQRNDVNALMCAMDVFMLPSLYEGLPLVGVEAQVNGLKCYFSDEIDKELGFLPSTEFVSLKNKNHWIYCEESMVSKRINTASNNCVFDIQFAAKCLTKKYLTGSH